MILLYTVDFEIINYLIIFRILINRKNIKVLNKNGRV